MRLLTENVSGNVHASAAYVNRAGRAKFLHQLVHLDSSGCIAIYKVHVYRDYVQLWHALGYTPDNLCPEEEFNQAPL